MVIRLVVSVCLFCLGSNFWKLWQDTSFLVYTYTSSEYLGQGRVSRSWGQSQGRTNTHRWSAYDWKPVLFFIYIFFKFVGVIKFHCKVIDGSLYSQVVNCQLSVGRFLYSWKLSRTSRNSFPCHLHHMANPHCLIKFHFRSSSLRLETFGEKFVVFGTSKSQNVCTCNLRLANKNWNIYTQQFHRC